MNYYEYGRILGEYFIPALIGMFLYWLIWGRKKNEQEQIKYIEERGCPPTLD